MRWKYRIAEKEWIMRFRGDVASWILSRFRYGGWRFFAVVGMLLGIVGILSSLVINTWKVDRNEVFYFSRTTNPPSWIREEKITWESDFNEWSHLMNEYGKSIPKAREGKGRFGKTELIRLHLLRNVIDEVRVGYVKNDEITPPSWTKLTLITWESHPDEWKRLMKDSEKQNE